MLQTSSEMNKPAPKEEIASTLDLDCALATRYSSVPYKIKLKLWNGQPQWKVWVHQLPIMCKE